MPGSKSGGQQGVDRRGICARKCIMREHRRWRTQLTFVTAVGLLLAPNGLATQPPGRAATGVLSLLVTDDATDAPLPGVRVTIAGSSREWMTDERGKFVLAVDGGARAILLLRLLGYEPGTM